MPIIREVSERFGADAARYPRARPTYPAGLIEKIASALPQAARRVVDVGIGTGIAATLLQQAGCRVLGVEPDERMSQEPQQAPGTFLVACGALSSFGACVTFCTE